VARSIPLSGLELGDILILRSYPPLYPRGVLMPSTTSPAEPESPPGLAADMNADLLLCY